jgi:hypothetical protein
MQVTIAGLIVGVLILALWIRYRSSPRELFQKLFLFSIVTGLILDVGYFAKIGSFEVVFNYGFSIVLLLAAIKVFFAEKPDHRTIKWILLFSAEVIFGFLAAYLSKRVVTGVAFDHSWDDHFIQKVPLDTLTVSVYQFTVMFLRILLFFVNVLAFRESCDRNWIVSSAKVLQKVSSAVILLWIVEFVCENSISPTLFRSWIIKIFGSSISTFAAPRQFLGVYVPLLTLREPSNLSFVYFVLALNSLFYFQRTGKKTGIFMFACLVLFLITGASLSSAIYLVCLALAILALSKKPSLVLVIYLLLLIPSIFAMEYLFGDRLARIFASISSFGGDLRNLPATSEIIRLYSIYNNLVIFLRYPLFGCGLGMAYSFSGFVTSLANIGILGVFLWTGVLVSGLKNMGFSKKSLVFGFVVLFLAFLATGHMGVLTYADKVFYLLLLLLSINRREQFVFDVCKDEALYFSDSFVLALNQD